MYSGRILRFWFGIDAFLAWPFDDDREYFALVGITAGENGRLLRMKGLQVVWCRIHAYTNFVTKKNLNNA